MSVFLAAVTPTLLDLTGIALAAMLIRVSLLAQRRWGIEIEARHREALHSALMSGIRAALGRGLVGQDAVDAAVEHAVRSVPDAIARLDPDTRVIGSIAAAKLREAVG